MKWWKQHLLLLFVVFSSVVVLDVQEDEQADEDEIYLNKRKPFDYY